MLKCGVSSIYSGIDAGVSLSYSVPQHSDRRTIGENTSMIEAVSCGGVVIYHGKILLLYKNYRNRYEGWVLPKGTVEDGETHEETALREVKEESGADADIVAYIGKNSYSFTVPEDKVEKDVHWYLMKGRSYYSKPQAEEYFRDSGFYKYHEAIHLIKFDNEREILEQAYELFKTMRRDGTWD